MQHRVSILPRNLRSKNSEREKHFQKWAKETSPDTKLATRAYKLDSKNWLLVLLDFRFLAGSTLKGIICFTLFALLLTRFRHKHNCNVVAVHKLSHTNAEKSKPFDQWAFLFWLFQVVSAKILLCFNYAASLL